MSIDAEIPGATPRRVLNLKAVVICATVAIVATIGMRKLHSSQVLATTQFLKQRAEEAVLTKHPRESIHSLELYLAFNGGDSNARNQLSELLSEHAPDDETLLTAYAMNEDMLLNDAGNDELRLRQAQLAVRLHRLSDADSHLKVLREAASDNAIVWHLSGVVAERTGHDDHAESYLEKSLSLDAGNASALSLLTQLMGRRQAPNIESEKRLRDLVTNHPCPAAWQAMASWLLEHDQTEEAVAALWKGLAAEPADVRLNGMLLRVLQSPEERGVSAAKKKKLRLVEHLRQQVKEYPMAIQLRLFAAHAEWSADLPPEAIQTLKEGITKDPQAWKLQESLVDYLVSLQRTDEARIAFERIPRSAIGHGAWHFLQGRLQMSTGNWNHAVSSFEQASGFAGTDTNIQHRANMCEAICRRELGHTDGAIEAYRAMLQRNPTSQDGRLGIAAARLESGQTDLAIAEYRQLTDVNGVPELLASLLIRETLKLPESRRNWREVESMLANDSNVITDHVQKRLLQADLLFGQGRPARALRQLDRAIVEWPKQLLFRSARRRLLDDDGHGLRQRMEETIARHPGDEEAYIVLIRLQLQHNEPSSVLHWIDQIRSGSNSQQLPETVRFLQAAVVAEATAVDLLTAEQSQASSILLEDARRTRNQLASLIPEQWPDSVAFTARHFEPHVVLETLEQMPQDTPRDVQAAAWLAALENADSRKELQTQAERALRALVASDPGSMALRLAYCEYLIHYDKLESALQIVRDIVQRESSNAMALKCCAWVLAMSGDSSGDAMSLSESASRRLPQDAEVRTTRGLVLAMSETPELALPVLQSVPSDVRSPESWAYEAWAHVRSGNDQVAAEILDRLRMGNLSVHWKPADRRLLERISSSLSETMTQDGTL
jgi:tetratricopeptide (TPR) repeat protein